MAGLGNPIAFELGGGPSIQESTYELLRQAVGDGNSAPGQPDESIIEAWRFARARALTAAQCDDRAAMQAIPSLATDMLDTYGDLLRLYFATDAPEEDRRVDLEAKYTRFVTSAQPTVEERLQEIDSSITIVVPDRDLIRETQPGRSFEDWDPSSAKADGPAFNLTGGASGTKITSCPNYSLDFVWIVYFPLAAGFMDKEGREKIARITALMREVTPAWCDFTIYTQASGFILDEDLLDITVF